MDKYLEERFCMEWFQYIIENPEQTWSWVNISGNESLIWKIVKKYPNKPWNWNNLSLHPWKFKMEQK